MGRCTKNLKLDFPPASLGKEKPSSEMVRRAVQVLTTACTWDRSKAQWAEPQTTGTGALSQKCCDKLWSDHLGWLFSVFHSLGSFNQILTLKCLQRNRKMCQFSRETPTDVKQDEQDVSIGDLRVTITVFCYMKVKKPATSSSVMKCKL